jgi:hypothetical protein
MSDHQSPRQPHRLGPIGLLARFRRWHATAPLWQVLLLTIMLVALIVGVWSGGRGVLRRQLAG